jgi:hypothetical protein
MLPLAHESGVLTRPRQGSGAAGEAVTPAKADCHRPEDEQRDEAEIRVRQQTCPESGASRSGRPPISYSSHWRGQHRPKRRGDRAKCSGRR